MALLCLLTMLLITILSRKNLLIVHVSFYMVKEKKNERTNTLLNLTLGVVVNSHLIMTYKKYRNKYFKYFRELGLDFKTCIDIKTAFKKNNDVPLCIDDLCEILDNHGYKHSLKGCTFDDLERYYSKYYKEYWLHDESYLLINNTIKVPVGFLDSCGNDFCD